MWVAGEQRGNGDLVFGPPWQVWLIVLAAFVFAAVVFVVIAAAIARARCARSESEAGRYP